MGHSLIGTTYDLLSFHKMGSYGSFERSFAKACSYHSIEFEPARQRIFRNWAFQFLRSTGYIDVLRMGNKTTWTSAPAALVECGKDYFQLVGTSENERSLRDLAPDAITEVTNGLSMVSTFSNSLQFFPNRILLRASQEEAAKISQKTGIHLSLDYQNRLFDKLPALNTVISEVLLEWYGSTAIFEPDSAKRFELHSGTWVPYSEMSPLEAGLFRREYEFARPDYYIAVHTKKSRPRVFRVLDPEWTNICFHAKLNLKIPMMYDAQQNALHVPKSAENLKLPTLLERCLRSGTLSAPDSKKDQWIYKNIGHRNLWRMLSKFPIFQVTAT